MKISFQIKNQNYLSDFGKPLDISIPLKFNKKQLSVFGAPDANAKPYQSGGFIGDTRMGGSVNCEEIQLIPHCNGTHTECVGHISLQRISVNATLKKFLIPSLLISIKPVKANKTNDTYTPLKNNEDLLITEKELLTALKKFSDNFLYEALIIRTLPNDSTKITKNYQKISPPFFSTEAMQKISATGTHHLLVDFPTVDRLNDNGLLSNHRIFWNVKEGSSDISTKKRSLKTITEMIFAKPSIRDGYYLLNLMMPSFDSDAAPSKPVLYKINKF